MLAIPIQTVELSRTPLLRYGFALRLAGCFVLVMAATVFVGLAPEANTIWVSNGLLLAYLLLAPRSRWPYYIAAGFAAQAIGIAFTAQGWQQSVALAALNMVEVTMSARLLRGRSRELPNFTDSTYLFRFAMCAVVACPVAIGLLSSAAASIWLHQPMGKQFVTWVIQDALGVAVATPACVAIFRSRILDSIQLKNHWLYVVAAGLLAIAIFSESRAPLAFLIYPVLLLIVIRLGLGCASLALVFISAAASWFTVHGMGPFAQARMLSVQGPSILLQLFLAGAIFIVYCVSVVLESHKAIEKKLRETVAIHKLVTENSRDVIILSDFDGQRNYVSPAALTMGGWRPEEMVSRKTLELVHALDKPKVEAVLEQMRSGAEGAVIEYRVRKRSGEYMWVESSLRTIRDNPNGAAAGVLNLVRDISERKRTEEKLEAAYRTVEALAVVDSLTGVANRRRLDQCLHTEWRRGLRERTPLSVLLLDADYFKAYNDTYGHVRGDNCLKQIAEAMQDVVSRPGDLVARYGGEEFAVVLPNTDAEGAEEIAHEICKAMKRRKLPHQENPNGVVTISIGCATVVPSLGQPVSTLIEMADDAMYKAKKSGRNRVCSAHQDRGGLTPAVEMMMA